MKAKFFEKLWIQIPGVIDARVEEIVKEALASLNMREQTAITSIYGITCEPQTYAKLAQEMGVSMSQVLSITRRGMYELRRSVRRDFLTQTIEKYFMEPKIPELAVILKQHDNLKEKVSGLSIEVEKLMMMTGDEVGLASLMTQPVYLLKASRRTNNRLDDECIRYIGELVQITEAEILDIPGFGRKCVNEIKELLSSRGLRLGMKFTHPENKT